MTDPALVHVAGNPDAARTHVLLIGIGTYDHLAGGTGERFSERLSQLESPVPSARSMADWFLTSFNNPERPLGSLSLVLSEAAAATYVHPSTGNETTVPRGSGDDIACAVRAWAARSAACRDNLCIFYFCGHGLAVGTGNSLLARDFGEDPARHDDGAVDANALVNAMKVLGPAQQFYLFDACRCRDGSLLASEGRRILSARPNMVSGIPAQAILYSALADTISYGQPGRPSVFTEHLLTGLGCAARLDENEVWWVDALSLRSQIDKRSRSIQTGDWTGQEVRLHKLAGEPMIPVKITCSPALDIHRSRLTCVRVSGDHSCEYDGSYVLTGDVWETFLAPDRYTFVARPSINGAFDSVEISRIVHPPHAEVQITTGSNKALRQ